MRRRTKDGIQTLTTALFEILGTGTFITVAMLLSQGRSSPRLLRCFARYASWRIRRALRRLKLRGYIRYDEEDERAPILLTRKGFVRSTTVVLQNQPSIRWDHLWRVVIFDIPVWNSGRKTFQRILRSIGCYRIQRSVYAYPHDIKIPILSMAKNLRIKSCVTVLTVPDLGQHEQWARRFFSLRSH
jgi:DNA-binding transcriptional regulator PaaX